MAASEVIENELPYPAMEAERLHTLDQYAILDTPPEDSFERIVTLATRIFDVPIALISLVDHDRQWFKACVGVNTRQIERRIAFCAYTILQDDVMVVPDTHEDARFVANPLVAGEPHIRFYAGAPLRTPDGFNLGTLCIMDHRPRAFNTTDRLCLADMAAVVMDQIQLRLAARKLARTEEALEEVTRRVSAATGVSFLRALVQQLTRVLGVKYALIGELRESEEPHIQTLAVCARGEIGENFSYPVGQSLSEKVITQKIRYCARGVNAQFPDDPVLSVSDEIESFMGVALEDNAGKSLGLLSVMDTRPLPDEELAASLLRLFATRTAAELERARAEEALRQSEQNYRTLFENANDAILIFEPADAVILEANEKAAETYGYPRQVLIGMRVTDLAEDPTADAERIWQALQGPHQQSFETVQRTKEGLVLNVLVSLSVVAYGGSIGVLSINRDITERKRAETRLRHAASHDALTGLANRSLFIGRLERAIQRPDVQFAVLFLDLDRFKNINDSLGHGVGDLLLVETARRLERSLRPWDTVARLGGDEFTILLERIQGEHDAVDVAERIQHSLAVPVKLGRHEVFTAASIGIALSASGYQHPDEVLRDADTAMYRAKARGKGRHEVFDRGMHTRAVALLQLETDLRRAVEWEAFCLQYEPIISLVTGEITGFEALVRWRHPRRGLIPPNDFIPVAEETGLIIPIGHWVLHEACKQLAAWRARFPGYPTFGISVNLSSKQVTEPGILDYIDRELNTAGLDPRLLKIEITEGTIMEPVGSTMEALHALHARGIQLCVDDFGTGYSSLSALDRFPAETLKIDRSFVSRIGQSGENSEIVRAIVALAKDLGREVVAEGIETTEQLRYLTMLGCSSAQGYLFSPTLDAEAVAPLLAAPVPWSHLIAPAERDQSPGLARR